MDRNNHSAENSFRRAGGCPLHSSMSRRGFLSTAGAGALAAVALPGTHFISTSESFVGSIIEPSTDRKAAVMAVFVRPETEEYWLGWPGASYDIQGHQEKYSLILREAAQKYDVDLTIIDQPIHNKSTMNSFLQRVQKEQPDGLIITAMSLNDPAWPHINHIAENRGDIPTFIFSPLGTSFTGHLQGTRDIPGVFVSATQNLESLEFGVRALNTIRRMRDTRLCIVAGDKTEDRQLKGIGTTLHYIPHTRFPDEVKNTPIDDEITSIADAYIREAEKIVEPDREDMLNAARNYVVAKRIMEKENCHGISVDCLPMVGDHEIPCPPCLAWSMLQDEGMVGACEADWNASIGMRLIHLLLGRPGFMQDPAPNTMTDNLMAAHCVSPTKLYGFDGSREPFILRSHSESDIGVATQVLWREDEKVTVMDFNGPESMYLGTGKVVGNNDTPPAGGCRTSIEITVDDVEDPRDVKGFHQLIIYGDHEKEIKAYAQLSGIEVVHI